MLAQIFRFSLVGAGCALIYSAVYLGFVWVILPASPSAGAVVPAFLISVYIGSHLQSRFTFGAGEFNDHRWSTRIKYFCSYGVGLMMNCLITWVITGPLQGPDWVPLIPSICITPTVTFALQRWWVFASVSKSDRKSPSATPPWSVPLQTR